MRREVTRDVEGKPAVWSPRGTGRDAPEGSSQQGWVRPGPEEGRGREGWFQPHEAEAAEAMRGAAVWSWKAGLRGRGEGRSQRPSITRAFRNSLSLGWGGGGRSC